MTYEALRLDWGNVPGWASFGIALVTLVTGAIAGRRLLHREREKVANGIFAYTDAGNLIISNFTDQPITELCAYGTVREVETRIELRRAFCAPNDQVTVALPVSLSGLTAENVRLTFRDSRRILWQRKWSETTRL